MNVNLNKKKLKIVGYLCLFLLFASKGTQTRHATRSNQSSRWRSLELSALLLTSHSRWEGIFITSLSLMYHTGRQFTPFTSFFLSLCDSQIQNLGYFPVRDLQLNIEIPEMTQNGNQLLQIFDFYIDEVSSQPGSGYVSFKWQLHGRCICLGMMNKCDCLWRNPKRFMFSFKHTHRLAKEFDSSW